MWLVIPRPPVFDADTALGGHMLIAAASLVSALTFASPPPPPPSAPETAQRQFGDYDGPALWALWEAHLRDRIQDQYHARLQAAGESGDPEMRRYRAGPSMRYATGYWMEFRESEFIEFCGSDTACHWRFIEAGFAGRPDDVRAFAETHFDGAALSDRLAVSGIVADRVNSGAGLADSPQAWARLVLEDVRLATDLETELSSFVRVRVLDSRSCPAVADWSARLNALPPLPLGGEVFEPGPDDMPYPIHTRQIIELPIQAFADAEVTVAIDGVRNPRVSGLWQAVTAGLEACAGE